MLHGIFCIVLAENSSRNKKSGFLFQLGRDANGWWLRADSERVAHLLECLSLFRRGAYLADWSAQAKCFFNNTHVPSQPTTLRCEMI